MAARTDGYGDKNVSCCGDENYQSEGERGENVQIRERERKNEAERREWREGAVSQGQRRGSEPGTIGRGRGRGAGQGNGRGNVKEQRKREAGTK